MKYNFVNDILNDIELITDTGINMELKEALRDIDSILDYSISIIDNKYNVKITLNELNKYAIDKVFTEIFTFIKYQSLNFYFREIEKGTIKYLLISVDNDNRGFYCEFSFQSNKFVNNTI